MAAQTAPLIPAHQGAVTNTMGPDTGGLIVCPTCDALYRAITVPLGAHGRCRRCGTILSFPRESAMSRIVMLAATSLVLLGAAVFFPFLELSAGGMTRRSSVLDAALAFSTGLTLPLALATLAFIVLLPALRLALIIYALAPMSFGWHAAPRAIAAFRWAEAMRPWAMAEIFVIGVAVALIKVAGLATVHLGIAFWAMVGLVVINVLNDNFMCRLTLWRTLEARSRS